ncbi:MAG: bifunctional 5,10-methylenetetrahydrofolate dehydrogenase/5,10-methenyltetrahydrofolate cyclohydrolase [Gemmatimonas sp.]|uniref:bifunctional 5,10-methylenetetrahydrofolate dehydrogenase/5,10-methenyltetrahydrofolate cyclohydrolase n=1 Tax=Gemmatimonas sp. TaxID=1962908 RepID=UPI0022C8D15A|nr:bifunctional 5,10-methylenetetrahydrofolate dehydrogenase/5,10-methenyltetrahydrofolate cyclohydrolase [Gemmatimonas sp.]MCA2984375.1 bifunctional 5,10-methylenetetrahydrofolate dehydrogenase/5,10-methenyltetrahydrofolate cyclohydrolase [Gemmatimonas sp.]MCA2988153.1 bifunctional 5,10-methylenetetrahydrofolate dehydrogenase/5,10-methenyltetrahydrofolate cyclohydrolase [Gemmatimonas sp.]MCA2994078.1 bifunctional 5,10-methylenetetrahydrofolate dehydrogenase/5,10-methenyltetrahydrofolate cyclohy
MRAELIDGKAIAEAIRLEVAADVAALAGRGVVPGLTVVLVGDDAASATYVGAKEKASKAAGMRGETLRLPASTTQAELLALVERLNADAGVHGILVQMPLPPHIDPDTVIRHIRPEKDVDGFHPVNVGKLLIGHTDGFVSCTPAGVIELLIRSGVETRGAEAVIVGRSNIVGKPMAALLVQGRAGGDATVTVCHSRTRDLAVHTKRADILIAAIGRAEMITGDMIKPGAVVIDVGMNTKPDASKIKGTRLCGDVHFESAAEVASKITPVPGGVGPMTIAMLLRNTVRAAERTVLVTAR